MRDFKKLFNEFIEDESGLTAVEYAIAGSLVAGTLVVAFDQLGTDITTSINNLCSTVNGDTGTTDCS